MLISLLLPGPGQEGTNNYLIRLFVWVDTRLGGGRPLWEEMLMHFKLNLNNKAYCVHLETDQLDLLSMQFAYLLQRVGNAAGCIAIKVMCGQSGPASLRFSLISTHVERVTAPTLLLGPAGYLLFVDVSPTAACRWYLFDPDCCCSPDYRVGHHHHPPGSNKENPRAGFTLAHLTVNRETLKWGYLCGSWLMMSHAPRLPSVLSVSALIFP